MVKYRFYEKGEQMKKLLFSILLSLSIANAGLIDAVALTVNNDAITLYDIEKKSEQSNVNKNQAVSMLIDELLYEQELKKHNITVSLFDVNNHLEKVAASNGLDLFEFRSIIRQQYEDYSVFEEETKKRILRDKLVQKLVRGNIKIATQEDLQRYYNNNMQEFSSAQEFEIVQYASQDKQALNTAMQNPMTQSQAVDKQTLTLKQNELNGQIKYLLNSTAQEEFTPVFTSSGHYVALYIKEKKGEAVESFEAVREKIFNTIMAQREQAFLKEYFEKLKITADIKVIR
jgi:hypothetical protein